MPDPNPIWSTAPVVHLGQITGSELIACRSIGFPEFQRLNNVNDTYSLRGKIDPYTGIKAGRLTVNIVDSPTPQEPKTWGGLSGAALFAADRLVGVITNVDLAFDSVVVGTPLAGLREDPDFCAALGQTCPLAISVVTGEIGGMAGFSAIAAQDVDLQPFSQWGGTAISADESGIAADRHAVVGIPVEQLPALVASISDPLKKITDEQRAIIADLERRLSVNEAQLIAFFRIIGVAIVGEGDVPYRMGEALIEIAQRYKKLLNQVEAGQGDDPAVARLQTQAHEALERGDLGLADVLLMEVEKSQSTALERLALDAATTRAQRGNIALTRLKYLDAADHFAAAADHVPAGNDDARANYLHRQAASLYYQGAEFGGNTSLLGAIAVLNEILVLRPRERVPLGWAATQNDLGNALKILGERQGSIWALEDAIAAIKQALLERTRDRVPLDWATTQNNLGNILVRLGERQGTIAPLEEAIAAFKQALLERTRERVPLDWAATQNNLGIALCALGLREKSIGHLKEAIAAHQQALLELTRERVPLQWAATQKNLGNALRALADREGSIERLKEAIAAYEQALLEGTRERVPLVWADTQNDLGNARGRLSQLEGSIECLKEAIAAFERALLERTRERGPLNWAATQHNLGNALMELGVRERSISRLQEAVAAYRRALLERERIPRRWATTQCSLGIALEVLNDLASSGQHLEEAITAYSAALDVCTREGIHDYAADVERHLRRALSKRRRD
jgi:tetratricopeptide (TPR) repeat protein